jgi:hypothetical protein
MTHGERQLIYVVHYNIEILNKSKFPNSKLLRAYVICILNIGACLEFSALNLGFIFLYPASSLLIPIYVLERTRMGFVIDLHQFTHAEVNISLCRGET